MARKLRHSSLEKRTARLKLTVRRKPYTGPNLARGVSLLYRRNKTNGTWVLKASDGHGKYWTKAIRRGRRLRRGNGDKILTFFEAQDTAKKLASGGTEANDSTAPITVDRALVDYRRDLISRNANPYNAESPRKHLTATLLSKPVAVAGVERIEALARQPARQARASVDQPNLQFDLRGAGAGGAARSAHQEPRRLGSRPCRTAGRADGAQRRPLRRHDPRLRRRRLRAGSSAWPVRRYAGRHWRAAVAAHAPSVEDLHDHPSKPKLMMPKSGKGGGRNRSQKKPERYSVPITVALSRKLKAAAKGRAGDAPLLLCADGRPWRRTQARTIASPCARFSAPSARTPTR